MAAGDGSAQEKLDIWDLGIILFGMVFAKCDFPARFLAMFLTCWSLPETAFVATG